MKPSSVNSIQPSQTSKKAQPASSSVRVEVDHQCKKNCEKIIQTLTKIANFSESDIQGTCDQHRLSRHVQTKLTILVNTLNEDIEIIYHGSQIPGSFLNPSNPQKKVEWAKSHDHDLLLLRRSPPEKIANDKFPQVWDAELTKLFGLNLDISLFEGHRKDYPWENFGVFPKIPVPTISIDLNLKSQ